MPERIKVAFVAPSHFVPLNASGLGTFGALAACSAQTLWAFLGLESATVHVESGAGVHRVEVQVARPSPNHIWIAGHWAWRGGAHVWIPGHWAMPPAPTRPNRTL